MEKITEHRLIAAGWNSERKISILQSEKAYKRINLEFPNNVKEFLEQFAYLKFKESDRKEDLEFNPEKAIGVNVDKEYFEGLLEEYEIDEKVYPIGEYCRGNLLLLMTCQNIFYCYTDGYLEKAGNSIEEMLDCLVGECRSAEVIE